MPTLKNTDQLNSSGSWWASESDDVETYLTTSPNGNYYAYFGNPSALNFRYFDYGTGREHDAGQCDWSTATKIFDEEGADNDRWVIIQAISFESLGITGACNNGKPLSTATSTAATTAPAVSTTSAGTAPASGLPPTSARSR